MSNPQTTARRPIPRRPAPAVQQAAIAATPRITQSVSPRSGNLPTPAEPQFDVPTLLSDIETAWNQLKANSAAYAAMNRAADPDESGSTQPPIMVWTANFNGKPVEVQTDLSELAQNPLSGFYDAMINLHGKQMITNISDMIASAMALRDTLTEIAKQTDLGEEEDPLPPDAEDEPVDDPRVNKHGA